MPHDLRPAFPAPCRADAEAFIAAIAGSASAVVTFQTFADHESAKSGSPPMVLHGTLAEHFEQLVALNKAGHGVFMMINAGDGGGRKAANVKQLRALFIDDDCGKVTFDGTGVAPFEKLSPSVSVQSVHGQHHYFVLVEGEDLSRFTAAQKGLSKYFGTDDAVSDLPRVMRMPGFLHMKDPSRPAPVRLIYAASTKYTINEVLGAYTAPVEDERIKRARAYVAKVPGAIEGSAGDVATYKLCCTLVTDFALARDEALDVLSEWNSTCRPPWSDDELAKKLDNGARYACGVPGSKLANDDDDDRFRVPSEQIAFMLPFNRFMYRRGNGLWNVQQPTTVAGARAHLIAQGTKRKHVEKIFKDQKYDVFYGFDIRPDAGPTFLEDGRPWANTFVPPTLAPTSKPYPRIEKILRTLTDDDDGYKWLFNWLAAKLQSPGERSMTAPVFQGPQGVGKSVLGSIVGAMIGELNCAAITQADIDGQFNSHFAGKLLVVANEVLTKANLRDTSSKLKAWLTEPTIMINGKGVPQYGACNRASWIFTSNSSTPVLVEGSDDRRYSVFSVRSAPSTEYRAVLESCFAGTEFSASFRDEISGLMGALMAHKVDRVAARRPHENAARASLAAASRSSTDFFFDELEERGKELIRELLVEAAGGGIVIDEKSWLVEGAVVREKLFEAYRVHARHAGYDHPVTAAVFGRAVHVRWPKVVEGRRSLGGRRFRTHEGLALGGRS
jgi:hypothetical protein